MGQLDRGLMNAKICGAGRRNEGFYLAERNPQRRLFVANSLQSRVQLFRRRLQHARRQQRKMRPHMGLSRDKLAAQALHKLSQRTAQICNHGVAAGCHLWIIKTVPGLKQYSVLGPHYSLLAVSTFPEPLLSPQENAQSVLRGTS